MINITIRFGASNELNRGFSEGTTVGTILADRNLKAVLGFGDNVQAVIDGQVQPTSAPIGDGDVVTIETRANSKASAISA